LATTIIQTTLPKETLNNVIKWLKEQEDAQNQKIRSIGIACFGPVDLDKTSPTYGYITTTPKPNWGNVEIVGVIQKAFPYVTHIGFDTDVNAPAVAELASKDHGDVKSLAYVTVGTGIGVGLALDNRPVHGLMHPEAGHIYTPLNESDIKNGFTGTCPFHGACLEGMSNGIAIAKRKNISFAQIKDLEDDDPVWDIVAHYYASLCVNLILIASVEVIVLGGGIFQRKILFPKVRQHTVMLLNGYVSKVNSSTIENQIKESAYDADAGIMGAFYLAIRG
jgi:fructokinase